MLHLRHRMVLAAIGFAGVLAGGPAASAFAGGSVYCLPQVADGRDGSISYTTEILINNVQATATTVTLSFLSDGGAPWVLDLRTNDRSEAAGVLSSTTLTLQPLETVNFFTSAIAKLRVGWATVQSSQPLVISSRFTMFRPGTPDVLLWQAAVLPSPAGLRASCEANVTRNRDIFSDIGADTGFAIANPSSEPATVTVSMLPRWGGTPLGQPAASATLTTLPPGGHASMFISELFKAFSWGDTFHGTLQFSSNVAVSVVALRRFYGAGTDIYSTVAVRQDGELTHNAMSEVEDNSSFALAQPVTAPVEITGTANYTDDTSDSDYFSVYLRAGQTIYAFLLADMIGSPFDGKLALYAPGQYLLAEAQGIFAGVRDGFLTHTANLGGTYYIKCVSATNSASRSAYYRLLIQVK